MRFCLNDILLSYCTFMHESCQGDNAETACMLPPMHERPDDMVLSGTVIERMQKEKAFTTLLARVRACVRVCFGEEGGGGGGCMLPCGCCSCVNRLVRDLLMYSGYFAEPSGQLPLAHIAMHGILMHISPMVCLQERCMQSCRAPDLHL